MSMKIGVRTGDGRDERLVFTKQIGADGGSIWGWTLPGFRENCHPTREGLTEMRERFERHHLMLTGIGIGGDCLKNQLLGLSERDRDIDNLRRTIEVMGEVYKDKEPEDRPVVIIDQRTTYWARPPQNWMLGAVRAATGRGGAHLHSFDLERIKDKMDAPAGEVSGEEVWERIAHLYQRIVPVAEEAKVRLATHPDDPPLEYYRGVHQALISFAAFQKFVDLVPSPYNGLLLCMGCFIEMGENIPEVLRYFGQRDKIFYVHFRNVRGKVPRYEEVFQDEGEANMVEAVRVLKGVGYQGFLVHDHNPGLIGDDPEWQHRSQAWQVGYIRGVLQALGA